MIPAEERREDVVRGGGVRDELVRRRAQTRERGERDEREGHEEGVRELADERLGGGEHVVVRLRGDARRLAQAEG